MSELKRWLAYGYSLVAMLLLAVVIMGAVSRSPVLLTAIRSESMIPTYQRGDIVFLWPVRDPRTIGQGDIIVFRLDEGQLASKGWVIHRVVGGDAESGFITQGDGNDQTDQAGDVNPPVPPEAISSRAMTVGSVPLKIPLLGFLPILAEGWLDPSYVMPFAALVLAGTVLFGRLPQRKKRKRKRNRKWEEGLIYLLAGMSLTVLILSAHLHLSKHIHLTYLVDAHSRGAVMGSAVGQLVQGETWEQELMTVSNDRGWLPLIVSTISDDRQVQPFPPLLLLEPGEEVPLKVTIAAEEIGSHQAGIWVAVLYPLLPPTFLHALMQVHVGLGFIAVSLVPALPLLLIPALDGRIRAAYVRGWARWTGGIRRKYFRRISPGV